jgi:cell division protein FtsX
MSDLATTDHTTIDLSHDGRERPSVRRTGWVRYLAVTTVVVLLIALSFVLGRVSNNDSGVAHAQTGQTAPAALSLQAEREAQARLVRANGTEVSDSGHIVPSPCRPLVPC